MGARRMRRSRSGDAEGTAHKSEKTEVDFEEHRSSAVALERVASMEKLVAADIVAVDLAPDMTQGRVAEVLDMLVSIDIECSSWAGCTHCWVHSS